MPTYDYACKPCSTAATIISTINSKLAQPKCPLCKQPMTRTYQAPGVTFKGDGWAHKEKGTK
jgi:putative FmdB family regulatory protein